MLVIGICDDEIEICDALCEQLKQLTQKHNIETDIHVFHDGPSLLDSTLAFDLLFLDIQIHECNGIDIAREIRKKDSLLKIILMTNYAEYAIEGYTIQAYRYLLKPIHSLRFQEAVEDLLLSLDRRQSIRIVAKNTQETISIPVAHIMFMETDLSKQIIVHTTEGKYTFHSSLSKYEAQLENVGFFRCHTSYLVNFSYARKIMTAEILLSDGTRIPVSKHRKRDLQEAFSRYVGALL